MFLLPRGAFAFEIGVNLKSWRLDHDLRGRTRVCRWSLSDDIRTDILPGRAACLERLPRMFRGHAGLAPERLPAGWSSQIQGVRELIGRLEGVETIRSRLRRHSDKNRVRAAGRTGQSEIPAHHDLQRVGHLSHRRAHLGGLRVARQVGPGRPVPEFPIHHERHDQNRQPSVDHPIADVDGWRTDRRRQLASAASHTSNPDLRLNWKLLRLNWELLRWLVYHSASFQLPLPRSMPLRTPGAWVGFSLEVPLALEANVGHELLVFLFR